MDNSLYISRIWTIYEQYVAAKLGVNMQFTLPDEPAVTLIQQLDRGKDGIQFVINAISKVDAASAKATVEDDEHKVKMLIRTSIGFEPVNQQVRSRIAEWIAGEFKDNIDRLVRVASTRGSRRVHKPRGMHNAPRRWSTSEHGEDDAAPRRYSASEHG